MELKARQDFYTIPDNISKYNLLTYQTQCPTELKHLLKFWFIITAFDLSLIIISSIENTAVKNIARIVLSIIFQYCMLITTVNVIIVSHMH